MLLPRNHHLQMSSCLGGGVGGGGRAYAFELEMLKSPSPSPSISSSPSPSSASTTLSESSNSGLAITTRKPRTRRKRPNQTYNEAAALLSTAYPNLFSPKHLAAVSSAASSPRTFSKSPFLLSDDSAELFFPFRIVDDDSTFLIDQKPGVVRAIETAKFSNSSNTSSTTTTSSDKSCPSPGEFDSRAASFCPSAMNYEEDEDFDYAEEVDDGGGIDSIMGNLAVESSSANSSNICFGCPMGLGLGFELGLGIGRPGIVKALRNSDDGNYNSWWNFPTVDMVELSPRFMKGSNSASEKMKKKKKMKKVAAVAEREKAAAEKAVAGDGETKVLELPKTNSNAGLGLLLKLNYDGVLSAWSDKGSPFSDEADSPGNDVAVGFLSSSSVRKAKGRKEKEKKKK